jgi:hypothetical protein
MATIDGEAIPTGPPGTAVRYPATPPTPRRGMRRSR